MHTKACVTEHSGYYAMYEPELKMAVNAFNSGKLQAGQSDSYEDEYEIRDGVAIIPIDGPMMRKRSKYGGCCTIDVRKQLRAAAYDENVHSILLRVNSGGGQVNGMSELAEAIRKAGSLKPLNAYVEGGMAASAAYWAASQAMRIDANQMARIGSIGVFAVLFDTSKSYEQDGIKVHLVSTGELKGALEDGVEITEAALDEAREIIADYNRDFIGAVASGRRGTRFQDNIEQVTTGATWNAQRAIELGLIDGITDEDTAVQNMVRANRKKRSDAVGRKERIRAMGATVKEIAADMNCHVHQVKYAVKELQIAKRTPGKEAVYGPDETNKIKSFLAQLNQKK